MKKLLAAVVSGLLLAASDHPLHWPALQFVAFVPWLLALAGKSSARSGAALGAAFAVAYTGPLLVAVGTDPPILVAVAAALVQWPLLGAAMARLWPAGPVRGPLAAAAAVTLAELAVWTLVPMFGTAQCFVRPLSALPALVGFVAWTGVAGLVFAVVAVQGLLVAARRGGGRPLAAAAALVAVLAVADWQRWQRPLGPVVQVAAWGWPADDSPLHKNRPAREVLAEALDAARSGGAALLVTPETGFWVGPEAREHVLALVGPLVAARGVALAFGVWHGPTRDNRIWFFAPEGTLTAEYRKTHLIPWLEDYVAGDGTLAAATLAGHDLGGMICQDDNFPDVARGYGRRGARLCAVPTNDWPAIREFHLENGVFRALENGYAVVRAASGGVSALVSPRGEVLARRDHEQAGVGQLAGAVPLGDGQPTCYARYGDLPIALLALGCLWLGWRRR